MPDGRVKIDDNDGPAQWGGSHAGQRSGSSNAAAYLCGLGGEFGILRSLCPAAGLGLLPDRTIQLLDRTIDDRVLRRAIAGSELADTTDRRWSEAVRALRPGSHARMIDVYD